MFSFKSIGLFSDESRELLEAIHNKNIKKLDSYELNLSPLEIVMEYPYISDLASQIVNTRFFWSILSNEKQLPPGRLYEHLVDQYGSYDDFKNAFKTRALEIFGSGWVFLVYSPTLQIFQIISGDGICPEADGYYPLIALDMWEHSYLLDWGINVEGYVDEFLNYIDWNTVNNILNTRWA